MLLLQRLGGGGRDSLRFSPSQSACQQRFEPSLLPFEPAQRSGRSGERGPSIGAAAHPPCQTYHPPTHLAGQISHVDEGVVEGGEDVSHTPHQLALAAGRHPGRQGKQTKGEGLGLAQAEQALLGEGQT